MTRKFGWCLDKRHTWTRPAERACPGTVGDQDCECLCHRPDELEPLVDAEYARQYPAPWDPRAGEHGRRLRAQRRAWIRAKIVNEHREDKAT